MLGENHDLFHEFPEYKDKIVEMRGNHEEFARIMDDYDTLDAKIRELELHDQPVADNYMEELKLQRVQLKDRLYELLKA